MVSTSILGSWISHWYHLGRPTSQFWGRPAAPQLPRWMQRSAHVPTESRHLDCFRYWKILKDTDKLKLWLPDSIKCKLNTLRCAICRHKLSVFLFCVAKSNWKNPVKPCLNPHEFSSCFPIEPEIRYAGWLRNPTAGRWFIQVYNHIIYSVS